MVTFPSMVKNGPSSNHTVYAKLFEPAAEGEHPGILLIHYLGTQSVDLLDGLSSWFAREGATCMMIYLPYYGPRGNGKDQMGLKVVTDLDSFLMYFRQAILDVRRAREVLATLDSVDARRVGIVGISLGALVTSVYAGIDGNLDHAVLVAGGGDLAKIAFHKSKETEFVRKMLSEKGIDEAALREGIRAIEPLTFASRVPKGSVIMFNEEEDEVIPKECTEALHTALGGPPIEWYPGNHKQIGLHLDKIIKGTLDFLGR